MSNISPLGRQLHNASDFGDANIIQSDIPVHDIPLDVNALLMEQNVQNGAEGSDSHGVSAHFMDFSYPFGEIHTGCADGLEVERRQRLYSASTRGSISEHRGSIMSIPGGKASFSSNAPLVAGRHGSMDGSDEHSPGSVRPRGPSVGEAFMDDFSFAGPGTGDGCDLGLKGKDDKNDLQPAWSELKTKAGKERKRLPLACIACRRKKIRCSGEKPACKHCLRSRIPCVYKVTTRKAAPRTDYMAMLDKRLKRMEERIIKIVPKDEQGDATLVVRAQVKPAIPGTIPVRSTINRKRIAEEAFGAELDAWSKSDPDQELSAQPNTLKLQEAEETRLLTEGADALPSQELQEHLAEVFFENLYGQAYHLLHKPSFMRKLKAGTVPPVLILAVCGISARFSSHPQLDTKPAFLRGEQWAKEARDIVMRRYDWPNITILTCLLLLGLHEFGTCFGGRSWAFGGMAMRMAFALQLHRDLEFDPSVKNASLPLSFVDREIRRRTMWACFLMDRFNSSGTDRPLMIREETLEVQLPICEKYFQLDMEGPTEDLRGHVPRPVSPEEGGLSDPKDNMGVAAYVIRGIALHGRAVAYLHQGGRKRDKLEAWEPGSGFSTLAREAEDFRTFLPSNLQYSKENLDTHETEALANQFLFLHIIAQYNTLALSHTIVQAYTGNSAAEIPVAFVGKLTSRAFDAGKRISEILLDADTHSLTAPFAGHCAVMSSIVQMAAAFSKNPSIEQLAKRNLATNVRFIAKMKRFWGTFHFLSENLREQFRACADAARQGPGAAKAPIFQYGDWFDRYPHGVSQTDFEDPAAAIKKEKGDDAVLEAKSDLHTVEDFFNSLSPTTNQDSHKKRRPSKKSVPPQVQKAANGNGIQHTPPPQQPSTMHHPQISMPPQGVPVAYPHQISPTDSHHNIFAQPVGLSQHAYYGGTGQELLFPPQPQPLLPQLDRQLVFGAYDGGTALSQSGMNHDGSSTNGLAMSYDDMNTVNGSVMGGLAGAYVDSSAWFMPFNMDPPNSMDGGEDFLTGLGLAGYGVHNGMGGAGGGGI